MAKEKQSFVCYYAWEKYLEKMTPEQAGAFFRAIFDYEIRGMEYCGDDPRVEMAMVAVSDALDRDREKYRATCERRREAGRKGGAPKGNQNASKQANQANGCFDNQNQAKQADNDHEHDNEHENVNDNEHEHDNVNGNDGDINKAAGAAAGRVMGEYMQLINCTPSPVATEGILKAVEELGEDVVHLAVCQTADSGNRSWNYLRSILERCRMDGINSRERWEEKERVREERKRIRSGAGSSAPEAAEPKIIRDDIGEMLKNGILI